MHDLLLERHAAAEEWRQRGAMAVPAIERQEWVTRYCEIVARGFATQPLPANDPAPKRQGRRKQSAAQNL